MTVHYDNSFTNTKQAKVQYNAISGPIPLKFKPTQIRTQLWFVYKVSLTNDFAKSLTFMTW